MLEHYNLDNIPKKKIIINVGRLVYQKNQALLIKAFSKIEKSFSDYDLHIYGQGKLYPKLIKLIKQLKLENKVFIYKNSADILKHIKTASLFVLTSKYEGMPNVVLEALAFTYGIYLSE